MSKIDFHSKRFSLSEVFLLFFVAAVLIGFITLIVAVMRIDPYRFLEPFRQKNIWRCEESGGWVFKTDPHSAQVVCLDQKTFHLYN